MALVKQPVSINFGKGVDTKTDKWQVQLGNFLALDNMSFITGNRLTKRYGYGFLAALPESATYVTTFNGNLTAIGSSLQALSSSTNQWINKGTLQPATLEVLPLIRSNTNQSQVDTSVSPNGLVCTVYTDQIPTDLSASRIMYVIANSVTGQNIIEPTPIPPSGGVVTGSARVLSLGQYFIIIFTTVIGGSSHLQYIAVSTNDPTLVMPATDFSSNYNASPGLSWDVAIYENNLFVAFDTTSGGQAIAVRRLTSTLILSAPVDFTNAGKVTSTLMSLCVDSSSPSSPVIWISYYDSVSSTGYACAVNSTLGKILSIPAEIITTADVQNLATAASNGVLTVYYEIANAYGYDSSLPTNYISAVTCTQSGTVGSPSIVVRSVGLASKAFGINGEYYFLGVYQSDLQSTYFLINGVGEVVSRLAYSNSGGYCTIGLPSVTLTDNLAQIGYLFKDFITSASTSQSLSITKSGIYSQTGINLVSFTIGTSNVIPVEIAQTLNLSGGFLWEYDGYMPVEQNFFLWPDDCEGTPSNTGGAMVPQEYQYQFVYTWTNNQGNIERSAPSVPVIVDMSTNNPAFTQPTPITTTAELTAGLDHIIVTSATGLVVGQYITDTTTPTNLLPNTYITAILGTNVTISQAAVADGPTDTIATSDICMVTLNVPTLRLTYKTANPVKIEGFRWSTTQEEFFQFTSIELPVINDTTVDYVTIVDAQADNQILGNSLIYTTGGVVENVGAPSFNALTLFDDRVWGIDAEDPNLLWNSKQVIENTPVEMSDLFTIYVAPSIASQGSTGNMKCIAPMDDKIIIFKQNALYYINGTGPDNTGASSQYSEPLFITSVVGSSNQQSIVFMPDGLMFQSDKGIWLLSRQMQVSYIGAPVEQYTKTALVQSAVAVPETTQVRFTLDSGITLVFDYFYGQWATFSGVPAISSTLYQNLHTFINANGQVFQETPGLYVDGSNPVLMSFTTSWINVAGLQGYQRAYFFYMLGQYISPHFLQYSICYDYNESPSQASLISPDNYSQAYGGDSPYGQGNPYGGPGDKEQWRVFLTKQRCQSFRLTMQEVFDNSFGIAPGAGLTISGLNLLIAVARGFRSIGAKNSVGANASGGGEN